MKHLFSAFSKSNIEKLKRMPKRKSGVIQINAFSVKYINPLSIYYEYKDIFKNRIYHFNTKKHHPFIIDAGGYIGMSALYFKSIYPNSKIIVFEPDPKIYKVLLRNIKQNKLTGINAINAGLGSENKEVDFYPDGADGGSLYLLGKTQKIKVKIVQLSNYITERVDFLKMNIEGAEYEVFKEIEKKLPLIEQLVFEYHGFYNLKQNLHNILSILDKNSLKYVVTDACNAKIKVPFDLPDNYRYFNIVYARQG
ncbi:FkbM family methyltransferase [candidate division WOR-3 bacterium]|nr:FkbM family methyltransferase [candidate division WOR-3 bacterium]